MSVGRSPGCGAVPRTAADALVGLLPTGPARTKASAPLASGVLSSFLHILPSRRTRRCHLYRPLRCHHERPARPDRRRRGRHSRPDDCGRRQTGRHRKTISGSSAYQSRGFHPDAGLDQHSYPCRHVAAPRRCRRHEAPGLAEQSHLPRRGQKRNAGTSCCGARAWPAWK